MSATHALSAACPKCGRDSLVRNAAGECYHGCGTDEDDARVERHWNTHGPDAAGKAALRALLAEVREDERRRVLAALRVGGETEGKRG